MADPKQQQDEQPLEVVEAPAVDVESVDTEGGRTDLPKQRAQQGDDAAPVEEDAPRSRPEDEGDEGDEGERERRRGRTAKAKREAQRRAKERDKARIAELEARLARIEGGVEQVRTSQQVQGLEVIQNRLNDAAQRMVAAQAEMAAALKDGDGVTHSQAMTRLLQAHNEAQQLSAALDYAKRQNGNGAGNGHAQPEAQTRATEAPRLNRDGARLRDEFLDEFDWLDTSGRDAESRTVMRIDDEVAAEGFDRNTAEYWDEVRARMKENDRLAHRFEERPAPRRQSSGPPLSGRREGTADRQGAVQIPAAMVKMMKDTGQWDDPARRAKVAADFKAQMAGLTPEQRASVMRGIHG